MKKYFNTIQMRMFRTYAAIIILMVMTLFFFINRFVFVQLREDAYNSLLSMAEAQSSFLDREVETMDSLALNMLCSFVIKDYLRYVGSPAYQEDEIVAKARDVSKQLASILAPYFTVQQIMLHDFTGKSFTSYNGYYKEYDIAGVSWYADALDRDGMMYLTAPYAGDDPRHSSDITNSESMLSLCRTAFDNYGVERGIVEVKQYSLKFFRNLTALYRNGHFENIIVNNDRGERIFEARRDGPMAFADGKSEVVSVTSNGTELRAQEKMLIASMESEYSGLELQLIQSRSSVMRSAATIVGILSISTIGILIIALAISYFAARQITAPVNRLRKRIHSIDAGSLDLAEVAEHRSGLIEIDDLNDTFNAMRIKLKDSIDEQILAHRQEAQYKMLALQSQMNPHFLYNSLAMISAMAEEGLTGEISYTCRNLSSMLRYSASGGENIVSLGTEMKHTREYLDTSMLRFKDKLEYHIDMDPAILDVRIPKLSIQPLAENSIKHCSRTRAPWHIQIRGIRDGNGWRVEIRDNGTGISEAALKEFRGKIESMDKERLLPSLELDGMGLLNVYIRLRMLYGESMVFDIRPGRDGGTVVVLGCGELS